MRRTSRYPTRSTVTRAQNSAVGSAATTASTESRSSSRTRAHDRMVTNNVQQLPTVSQNGHTSYNRQVSHHPASHQSSQHHQQPHAAAYPIFRNHPSQGSQNHLLQNGTIPAMMGHMMTNPPPVYRQPNFPTYSMPIINETTLRSSQVEFIKLNSYDTVKELIKARGINMGGPTMFNVNDVSPFIQHNDNFKVFLRFCKYSSAVTEQNDCLPKSFNLVINSTAFQVKNKYTFAPYDITTRVACERNNDVYIKCSLDPNSNEFAEEFYFGLFLVKKVDHKKLFQKFKTTLPYDIKHSIDLVRKKLNPDEDDDEIAIVENADLIKISLLCPLSATRIKVPARSKYCDHVHCFDAESFININEITPRWKCPICKLYIKLDDMIVDSLFLKILKQAPPDVTEAEIYPDGQFKYVQECKPNTSASNSAANHSSSNNNSTNSTSTTAKRKLEEEDSTTVVKSPVKAQKVEKQIECITLDSDSDDDDADSDSTITDSPDDSNQGSNHAATTTTAAATNGGDSKNNKDDDSDDDIMIVFEKIAPATNSARSTSAPAATTAATSSSRSTNTTSQSSSSNSANARSSVSPYNSSSTSSPNVYNNPNSRYTATNTASVTASSNSTSESHRAPSHPPSFTTQVSAPVGSVSQANQSDVMNMYSMFKYPNANSYNQPSTSSAYNPGFMNSMPRNPPSSSVSNGYLPPPPSSMYSNVGTLSTASQSMTSGSQSLIGNYQPPNPANFLSGFMSSNNPIPSTSYNAPSTSNLTGIIKSDTTGVSDTSAFPDFADALEFSSSWFNSTSHSKDPIDFNIDFL